MDTKNKNSRGLKKPKLRDPYERREPCVYGPPLPQAGPNEDREACVYGPPLPRPSCRKKFLIAICIAIGAVIAFLLYLCLF